MKHLAIFSTIFLLTVTVLAVQQSEGLPSSDFDSSCPRYTWVWKLNPVNSKADRAKLFDLCQSAGISGVYLYMPMLSPGYAQDLEIFLKEAHAKSIKVEALDGDSSWAFERNHKNCLKWVESILAYNQGKPADAQLDGISLDVEPHVAKEWQYYQERVSAEFVLLLEKIRGLINKYAQPIEFNAATAPFYAEINNGKFSEDIFRYVDSIALMDYFDNPKTIAEQAKAHLLIADKMNKKVVIGVETQDLVTMKQGGRRNTFFEEGWEYMEQALAKVKEKVKGNASFAGFAIHCDYSYIKLQKGRNAPTRERGNESSYIVKSVKITKDIKIDTDASDWDISVPFDIYRPVNVVYGKSAWGGPKDSSISCWSAWDDNNLYFLFRVIDDKIVQKYTGEDMWKGDHVELWLDTDLKSDYKESINSEDDFQFGFSPGNFSNLPPEAYIWTPALDIDYKSEIQLAAKRTEDGYILEVKIPVSVLNIASGKFEKSDEFGISVDLSDTDDAAVEQKALISSSVDRAWGDPTTFGVLELE